MLALRVCVTVILPRVFANGKVYSIDRNILRMDNFANICLAAIKIVPSTPSVRVIAQQTKPEFQLCYVLPIPNALSNAVQYDEVSHQGSSISHHKPVAHLSCISSRVVTLVGKASFSSIFSRCRIFCISTLLSLVQPRPGSPPSPATDLQCAPRPTRKATPPYRRPHLHDERARFGEDLYKHVRRKKWWVNGDQYHLHFQPKAGLMVNKVTHKIILYSHSSLLYVCA